MDKIGANRLRGGDVLLYNGNSWISKAIQFMDGTEVNHAAICLGRGKVGEALETGLTERTFRASAEDDRYVIISRLSAQPGTMKPVMKKACDYLKSGNRYGYEQIVLLAFLGITRKLPVNPYLKWLIRVVLDQAAHLLMISGDKQPMICSEFVYRCYDDALPISTDPYTLRIRTFPMTGAEIRTRAQGMAAAPHRCRMHPDSLLAWAEDVMTPRKKPAADPLTISFERPKEPEGKGWPPAADGNPAAPGMDALIEKYLEATKSPATRAFDAGASLRTPQMLAGIVRFAEAYATATKKGKKRGAEPWSAGAVKGEAPSALGHLFSAVADFVTPGDLLRCGDLFHVGKIETVSYSSGYKRKRCRMAL